MMKDDDFKLLKGFALGRTNGGTDRQTNEQMNEQTDICDCRVSFTTENKITMNITLRERVAQQISMNHTSSCITHPLCDLDFQVVSRLVCLIP